MIELTYTNQQLFNGKHTQFFMVEFKQTVSVMAGQTSDTIKLVMPPIPQSLSNYVCMLKQFSIKTESTKYEIFITDNIEDLPSNSNRPILRVANIDTYYNETNIDTFLDNETQGVPLMYLTIVNTDITNIINLSVRVVVEIFQQPIDGIGQSNFISFKIQS